MVIMFLYTVVFWPDTIRHSEINTSCYISLEGKPGAFTVAHTMHCLFPTNMNNNYMISHNFLSREMPGYNVQACCSISPG